MWRTSPASPDRPRGRAGHPAPRSAAANPGCPGRDARPSGVASSAAARRQTGVKCPHQTLVSRLETGNVGELVPAALRPDEFGERARSHNITTTNDDGELHMTTDWTTQTKAIGE